MGLRFLEMLKRLLSSLFQVLSLDTESRKPKEVKDASVSVGNSLKSNEFCVRVVHAGGREDLYRNPVAVSQLIKKHPGMCIALPQVFKNPHEAVLLATEMLLPGQKYYLVPGTTLKKLKKKHPAKNKSTGEKIQSLARNKSNESVCSANEYVSKERRSRCLVKKHKRPNRELLPPVTKSRSWRGLDWEPSLTSIQEISP